MRQLAAESLIALHISQTERKEDDIQARKRGILGQIFKRRRLGRARSDQSPRRIRRRVTLDDEKMER